MRPPELASTAQYIAWHAVRTPNAIAIVEDDRLISYAGMAADLMRCARAIDPAATACIVDDAGNDLPPGRPGIIRVRTDTMVDGYLNDETLTKSVFVDGWFQTSDIGLMPEPGRLIVLGRADDMLNFGGVKVPPAPIEQLIRRIDGVSDAAVVSVAGENAVDTLVVAVEAADASAPDLERWIGAIISRYAGTFSMPRPRDFPRTGSGTVRRRDIEAAFRRDQAGEGSTRFAIGAHWRHDPPPTRESRASWPASPSPPAAACAAR